MTKQNQIWAVLTSNLIMVTYGMSFGWPSPSLAILFAEDSPIKVTSSEGSWLSVMPYVGAIIGAPLCGVLADAFGRKTIILASLIPYILCWSLIAVATNIGFLIFARFWCGLAGGANFTALPAYVTEITDPTIRGTMGGTLAWMWNFGILLIYIGGPFVSIKTMALISISVPILCFFTFIWMPESPYYHVMKGNTEEAKRILNIFRGYENTEDILKEIQSDIERTRGNILYVCKSPNRRTLFLAVILMIVQELSGRAPFLFYSEEIFQLVSGNFPAYYISMIFAFIQLLASFVATITVDKYGRKPLLITSSAGVIICLLTEGLCFHLQERGICNNEIVKWIAVISLILFIIIFTIGLGVVPMILIGEILATNVKNVSLGIVDVFSNFSGISTGKFFQMAVDEYGLAAVFWSFAAISVGGFVFIIFMLPETKHLSLEQIQEKLHKHR